MVMEMASCPKRIERARVMVLVSILTWMVVGLTASVGWQDTCVLRAEPPIAPTREQIDRWIRQLGDNGFRTRDEAMQQLILAGEPVLEPLAVALTKAEPEVAARGVHVLAELLRSDSFAMQDGALSALQQVADSSTKSVARRAQSAIAEGSDFLAERTIEHLAHLGANTTDNGLVGGIRIRPARVIELGEGWTGKETDLRLLRRLYGVSQVVLSGPNVNDTWLAHVAEMPNLEAIRISRGKITSEGIGHLKKVKGLSELILTRVPVGDDSIPQFAALPATRMDLFGTRITKDGYARLKAGMPNTMINFRGVFLGIKSQQGMGWFITAVEPDTPAERAGIRAGDVIRRFGGKEVPEFETLAALIAAREPGDRVEVEISRNSDIIKTTVVFE